jgi:putative flippase GtrA
MNGPRLCLRDSNYPRASSFSIGDFIMETSNSPVTRLGPLARLNPKETQRFMKFLVVGAFGFVVDFGGFNLFHALHIGPWVAAHLVPAGMAGAVDYLTRNPEVIEQAMSFCAAVISNFLWNYFWLYPEARDANQAKKIAKFFVVSVAGLLIGGPIYSLALFFSKSFVAAAGLATLSFNLAGNLALVCRVGVLLFWNFFVNRYWTYREVA